MNRKSMGKPIVKIYGRTKDLVCGIVGIGLGIFILLAANQTTIDMVGKIFLYIPAVLLLIYAVYLLYQFCHVLILCEDGLVFRNVFGQKVCRYEDCAFSVIDTQKIPEMNKWLALAGFSEAGPGYEFLGGITIWVYTIEIKNMKRTLRLSSNHYSRIEERIQRFNIQRQRQGKSTIEYKVTTKELKGFWSQML